jgi:hypothetical protein
VTRDERRAYMKVWNKAYYAANKDAELARRRAYNKAYNVKHKERLAAAKRAAYVKGSEHAKAEATAYYHSKGMAERLARKYGMTVADRDALLASQGARALSQGAKTNW